MDPITQGILGGSLFTLVTGKQGWKPFMVSAVITNLPDFDIFFSHLLYSDPIDQLFAHRGITHTLVGGLTIGLLAALVWRLVEKKQFSFWRLLIGCWLCIFFGHLIIDRFTSYGMRWLLPRSEVTTSLDSIFVVDIGMRIVLFTGFFSYLIRKNKKQIAIGTVLVAIGYFCFAAGVKQFADTALQKQFIEDHPNTPIISQVTTPEPFQPFLWRAIIQTAGTGQTTNFTEGRWSVFDSRVHADWHTTTSDISPEEVMATLDTTRGKQFAKIVSFARGQLALHQTAQGVIAENIIFGPLNGRVQATPSRGFQFLITPNNIERQGDMPRFTDGRWSTFRARVWGYRHTERSEVSRKTY